MDGSQSDGKDFHETSHRFQRVVRFLHVKENGLKIMLYDNVHELPDGQDMVFEMSDALSFENAAATGPGNLSPALEVNLSYKFCCPHNT